MSWRNRLKRKEQYNIHPKQTILVFDTETTGLDEKAKIIQFSGFLYEVTDSYSLSEIGRRDLYINPKESLSKKIVEITGITDDILKYAPNEYQVSSDIISFIEKADIIAGYNVDFDIRMVKQMCKRLKLAFDIDSFPKIDCLEMARDWIDYKDIADYKLETIFNHICGKQNIKFHSAFDDAQATAMLIEIFCGKYRDWSENTDLIQTELKKAGVFVNPNRKSQQRLVCTLNIGDRGDIFYDIFHKCWNCKATTAAKRIFKEIDKCDLERQFLEKYGYPFNLNSMDAIGKSWLKYQRQNKSKAT